MANKKVSKKSSRKAALKTGKNLGTIDPKLIIVVCKQPT